MTLAVFEVWQDEICACLIFSRTPILSVLKHMGQKDTKVSSKILSGPDCWVSRVEMSSVFQ